jgi:hypothetical protein
VLPPAVFFGEALPPSTGIAVRLAGREDDFPAVYAGMDTLAYPGLIVDHALQRVKALALSKKP